LRFRFDSEHDDFRASLRSFLADAASDQAVRRDMDTEAGWSADTWRQLCADLELPALAVPEKYGGAGFGLVELGIAMTEAGRSLLCSPLLSTSLAAQTLLHADDHAAAAAHLPGLASGQTTGTLAAREPGGAWDAAPTTRAERAASGWTLTGEKDWVLDGHTAQLLVVTATAPAGTSLFLVDADAPDLHARSLEAVDPTRKVAHLTFAGTPAVLLGAEGGATEPLRRTLDIAITLLAAEQTGVAKACLDTATSYAGSRHQFGRPIGSFQAVKHKLATVLLEVESAVSASMYATWSADEQPAELPEVARIAGVTCGEAALLAASENIQVHGGMGITWEHSAHLYLKRATTSRLLFGDPQHHLEALARLTGITPRPDVPATTIPG
jgi:alkylation response protein AidB-like acyl-CoA dehydrogenase